MCTHKHRAVSNQPRATFLFSFFFVFCRFLSCTVASRLSLVLSNNSGAPSLSTYHSHSLCLSLWGYWLLIINSFFSDSVPSQAEWAGGSRGVAEEGRREIERAIEGGRGEKCMQRAGRGYAHHASLTGVGYAQINVLCLNANTHNTNLLPEPRVGHHNKFNDFF